MFNRLLPDFQLFHPEYYAENFSYEASEKKNQPFLWKINNLSFINRNPDSNMFFLAQVLTFEV